MMPSSKRRCFGPKTTGPLSSSGSRGFVLGKGLLRWTCKEALIIKAQVGQTPVGSINSEIVRIIRIMQVPDKHERHAPAVRRRDYVSRSRYGDRSPGTSSK